MGSIVAICGFIGSGKGTVGDILVRDYGFIQESFARPLKDAAAIIFNWDRKLLEGDTKESREWRNVPDKFWSNALGREFTPRLALQLLGTEAGRNVFGEPIWTSALINRLDPNKDYVITDCRFVNEYKAVKSVGGYVVQIKRGPDPEWLPAAKEFLQGEHTFMDTPEVGGINGRWAQTLLRQLPHRSEWDWVNCKMDVTIKNDDSLEELAVKVHFLQNMLYQPVSHMTG